MYAMYNEIITNSYMYALVYGDYFLADFLLSKGVFSLSIFRGLLVLILQFQIDLITLIC